MVRKSASRLSFSATDHPFSSDDGTWAVDMVAAHAIGCNSVSWAPAAVPGALISAQQFANPAAAGGKPQDSASTPSVRRFASAGCDNSVKIWEFR